MLIAIILLLATQTQAAGKARRLLYKYCIQGCLEDCVQCIRNVCTRDVVVFRDAIKFCRNEEKRCLEDCSNEYHNS
ncbi:hypothetical protein LSAT2_007532 [Lamellibrachia satsuma]|nr:hypothetical protein LSAT2_007532 [Lamellibrachia satsuma]